MDLTLHLEAIHRTNELLTRLEKTMSALTDAVTALTTAATALNTSIGSVPNSSDTAAAIVAINDVTIQLNANVATLAGDAAPVVGS